MGSPAPKVQNRETLSRGRAEVVLWGYELVEDWEVRRVEVERHVDDSRGFGGDLSGFGGGGCYCRCLRSETGIV